MLNWLKNLWVKFNEPSAYDLWKTAFEKLQIEKHQCGKSGEYWHIWYNEVCPAYRALSNQTPKRLCHVDTDAILYDMDKPVNKRHFY